jgi:integrase
MGKTRAQPSTLDLFSTASGREPSSPSPLGSPAAAAPSRRHVLPKDLTNAVRHLEDKELDQLFSAVLAEQKRRGKNHPNTDGILPKRIEAVAAPLTQGKLNAVRAAFKAGVTPSRIARQFGNFSVGCAQSERAGQEAKLGFKAHPHMLRHACGYALANKGHDTRSLSVNSTLSAKTISLVISSWTSNTSRTGRSYRSAQM